ncbi:MAG: hypothetical protein LBR89_03775 [Holosporales bacterium]|nr:hypothetical protein [Holosporales bacterium]
MPSIKAIKYGLGTGRRASALLEVDSTSGAVGAFAIAGVADRQGIMDARG